MADQADLATKQDLLELKLEFKKELVETESRIKNEFKNELVVTESRIKNELIEAMRDMQTEILRGIERFARGNFSRLHRLETSDTDLNERINSLEERVLALETRRPPL
jgi:hypothetical protein